MANRQYQNLQETQTVTIANGAALSGALDCAGLTPVVLLTPAAWTAAAISFDVAFTSGSATFYPLYDASVEVTIPSSIIATAEARAFALDPAKFVGVRQIKVRSGVNGTTVNQGAARTVTIGLRAI